MGRSPTAAKPLKAVKIPKSAKPRRQYAALPYRLNPQLEILLVTSRGVGRWIIPKGWPVRGKSRRASAAVEALEEAGVVGPVGKTPIGAYDYVKVLDTGEGLDCVVTVFPLRVTEQKAHWREQEQRQSSWFDWRSAAETVDEAALAEIIRRFAKDFPGSGS
jgi:8-oxo-dGTP pyrophosphatase MutT (NUDIX family)